jgi:hypothetical protein
MQEPTVRRLYMHLHCSVGALGNHGDFTHSHQDDGGCIFFRGANEQTRAYAARELLQMRSLPPRGKRSPVMCAVQLLATACGVVSSE